jgi:hypothetical protein
MAFPCIYVYIGSSYFSSFYLSPLLMVISTGLKILCSFVYRKYISLLKVSRLHVPCRHLLTSDFTTPTLPSWAPLRGCEHRPEGMVYGVLSE